MDIRDIVNRDIVNLQNCEQEPIHIPGSIQPHGFLLGLKESTFVIDFCSGNTIDYINRDHKSLLGTTFADAFGEDQSESLIKYIDNGQMLSSSSLKLTLEGIVFLCTVHNNGEIYIVEAEPYITAKQPASDVYNHTSQFLNYMHGTHTLKELCSLVAKGTREITGYDRVMIYRFDKDYNGEVFAESKREDLEPFLGLHYPHTDIPRQARELYMQNLLRLITDINYTPVPIYTVDDSEGKNLDLSLSILRSTSPIHVKYLHNIGVGASLTISLIHNKKLWGLIACHHYSGSKNLTPDIRLAAQLQGHFITSQIDLRQTNEEYDVSRKTSEAFNRVNRLSLADGSTFNDIVKSPDMLDICNASGVSIVFDNSVYSSGLTPKNSQVLFLSGWLAAYTGNDTYNTDKLIDLLPEHKEMCANTSGILYHPLDSDNNNCIIWYRPETKTEVNWAGDPNKSIIYDANGLSPRNSFELWKEIINYISNPWLQPELNMAASYAQSLQKQINLLIISQEEEKYRKLSELLKETNSELENINWISTHDLQEPLRKIQLLSSRLLVKEKEIPVAIEDTLKRMNTSANRMQTLLIDILKYTRLRHTEAAFETVDLNEVIERLKGELSETVNGDEITFIIDELPTIDAIPFLINQLFSNLISNSIKYSDPDKKCSIKVTASHNLQHYPNTSGKELYQVIYLADNGIGFEQSYAESIFNIFTRLHSNSEYKGSGVGLALCKKIMQNHKGHIMANSEQGTGTVISMFFPV